MKRRSVVPGTLAAISFLLFNAFSWRKSIFENHLTAFCRHIHSQSYHHKLWLFRAHDMDSFTGCLLFRCFELLLRRSMLLATTPGLVWGGNKYSGLWTCGDRIYEFAHLKVGMRRRWGGAAALSTRSALSVTQTIHSRTSCAFVDCLRHNALAHISSDAPLL